MTDRNWRLSKNGQYIMERDSNVTIATVSPTSGHGPLLAAAPDLYRALKMMVGHTTISGSLWALTEAQAALDAANPNPETTNGERTK